MKSTGVLWILFVLVAQAARGQTKAIHSLWARSVELERQPSSLNRDTLLAVAYASFIPELIKKEPADSGVVYADKVYHLAETRSWQKGLLLALLRKASCLNIANRHYEALRIGLQGLKQAEHHHDVYFQALFHRSLGNNYDMLDNYDKAIPHYETCLRLSAQVPALQLTRAHALVELGDAYRFNRKRPDQSKTLIEQAIAIYKTADTTALGYAYDYYGQALTDLNLFQEAEASFARSHRYYKLSGKEYLLPELLLHEAELYVAAKDYLRASDKAHTCLAYSQQKGSLYGQRGAYRILYEAQKAIGDLREALASHEQFLMLNDSINQTKNNERFQAVRSDYELKTQQEQINQLTIEKQRQTQQLLLMGVVILLLVSAYVFWSNRRLRRKNQEITAALVQGQALERQRVAADLHDNLGSTLSALRWNLDAMDKSRLSAAEQTVYATIRQQISQAYNDVRLLSHNLLPDELARQGLTAALQNLVDKMNRNAVVHFRLTGADALPRLERQVEFELYSICLELLNNTIKHANATECFIDLTQTRDSLQLTVGDNGTGFDEARKEGRGLQNVTARVKALHGTWIVESISGQGVLNRIVVPLKTPTRVSSQI